MKTAASGSRKKNWQYCKKCGVVLDKVTGYAIPNSTRHYTYCRKCSAHDAYRRLWEHRSVSDIRKKIAELTEHRDILRGLVWDLTKKSTNWLGK